MARCSIHTHLVDASGHEQVVECRKDSHEPTEPCEGWLLVVWSDRHEHEAGGRVVWTGGVPGPPPRDWPSADRHPAHDLLALPDSPGGP